MLNAKMLDSVAGGLEGRGKMRRGVLNMACERTARKQGEEGVERESRGPVRERRAKIASMARSVGAEVKRRRHATKPDEARFARIAREGRAFRTGTSDEPRCRAASGVETAKFGRDRGRSRTQMIQARRFAAGLRPEANLMIAERSQGLANRPHQFIEYGCLVSRPSLVQSRSREGEL